MHLINDFNINYIFSSIINLAVALILGVIIGSERQYRHRSAGLRTNTLVAVGAAAFVNLAVIVYPGDGTVRVISYVVSGIGFLGAGVIIREGSNVRGINTAATLWSSAAVGACAGAGMIFTAFIVACFILIVNTILRPMVYFIERNPYLYKSKAINTIHIICEKNAQTEALNLMVLELEKKNLALSEKHIHDITKKKIEIQGIITITAAQEPDLDAVVENLQETAFINKAFWLPISDDNIFAAYK